MMENGKNKAEKGQNKISHSRLGDAVYQFSRNRLAVICLIVLLVIIFSSVFADFVAPYGIDEQQISDALMPPSLKHWFGTDNYGRDIFSRVLYGGRISLLVAMLATILSTAVGVILGSLAGYYGGKVDNLIMRIMDIFMAIPSLLMAIVLATSLGAGLRNTVFAIAISAIPSFTRVVRAPILAVKQNEYIEASRAIGARPLRLIIRHILPNVLAIIIVQATLGVANSIISVASLRRVLFRSEFKLFGLGRTAADSGMGNHALHRKILYYKMRLAGYLPGSCDCPQRYLLKCFRRRAAGCAGPAAETIRRMLEWTKKMY